MASIQGKSLLGLQGVPKEDIEMILRVAKKMKAVVNSGDKKLSLLRFAICFGNRVRVHAALLKWQQNI